MSAELKLSNTNGWWTSYVNYLEYANNDEYNKELAEIAKEHCKNNFNFDATFKHSKPCNVLLLYKSKALNWLLNEVIERMKIYIKTHYDINFEDLDVDINMWGNHENQAEWSMPHAHQGNQMVITYYPYVNVDRSVHEYAGSFCFHPPTTFMPDQFIRKEKSFVFYKLHTGSMIIFNGYTTHSTLPLFSKHDEKIALISNIRFRLKGSKATYTPIKELLEYQSK